ncbi:ribosomal protein S18-alanine N-acetyltransferase [Halonatronum saccharophilum]|uniref:ribosomal protein S18-alanine N-acetyltransferase n=1 Tax=Halonatronum saccharophilum TaxID=150060 RepID=UPI0004806779|nr:ribosomal protein S18-alanine N-acetyltransferase [Halonatronum saccharophilum]
MDSLEIRGLRKADLEDVLKIERDSFSNPWSKRSFKRELNNEYAYYLVVQLEDKVVGYMGGWLVLDECHITNLAIDKGYRKNGIATKLLRVFCLDMKGFGIKRATLEVRVSNEKAQALYLKENFREFGIRKNYYSDNKEDAVIMWKELF